MVHKPNIFLYKSTLKMTDLQSCILSSWLFSFVLKGILVGQLSKLFVALPFSINFRTIKLKTRWMITGCCEPLVWSKDKSHPIVWKIWYEWQYIQLLRIVKLVSVSFIKKYKACAFQSYQIYLPSQNYHIVSLNPAQVICTRYNIMW